jgi:hypothetical protein
VAVATSGSEVVKLCHRRIMLAFPSVAGLGGLAHAWVAAPCTANDFQMLSAGTVTISPHLHHEFFHVNQETDFHHPWNRHTATAFLFRRCCSLPHSSRPLSLWCSRNPTLGGLLLKLNRGIDVGLRLARPFAAVLPTTANLVRPVVRGRNSPVW